MTDAELEARGVLHNLIASQTNLFHGVAPTQSNGRQMAEFMIAFIERFAEKLQDNPKR